MATSESVTGHYGRSSLEQEILAAFEAAGQTVDVEGLAAVDEFHTGGRRATEVVTAQLGVRADSRVLDVGCGIGGTARFIASTYGCQVTGVDLTEDYVKTAQALSERTGLADRVAFRRASALELPFPAASFDAACMLHVGMNIEDKDSLCAELARVLRPGGSCAIFDIMHSGDGDLAYPVPWANSPAISFLANSEVYQQYLIRAGLEVNSVRDWTGSVLEFLEQTQSAQPDQPQDRPALGPHLLMEDIAEKQANVLNAMHRGAIAPTEIIATRRGASVDSA